MKNKIKPFSQIIQENPKSSTPLQDYTIKKGLDKFYKSTKLNMTYGEGHDGHISKLENIEEDTKKFLDNIANQLNKFFMGKNSKGFWYHSIEFKYSVFTGYQPYIEDVTKNKFG